MHMDGLMHMLTSRGGEEGHRCGLEKALCRCPVRLRVPWRCQGTKEVKEGGGKSRTGHETASRTAWFVVCKGTCRMVLACDVRFDDAQYC